MRLLDASKYDDDTVQRAVSLLKTLKNVSKVSRLTGIPRSVLTSWRDGTRRAGSTAVRPIAGVAAASGALRQASVIRAEKLTKKWDRSTTRSLDVVNSRLDQLDKKLRNGGNVTTDDVRGIKELAWTAAVGTDKLQILTGGVTLRSERRVQVSLVDPGALRSLGQAVIEAGGRPDGDSGIAIRVLPIEGETRELSEA
jgi:hypothetical protein